MQNVLFIDDVCPKPYDSLTLKNEGLGGSEASLVRVAEGLDLTNEYGAIVVEQHNREHISGGRVVYADQGVGGNFTAVVCMRTLQSALNARKRFPKASVFLWLHDWAGQELALRYEELVKARLTIVCVSNTHKAQVQMTLAPVGDLTRTAPIRVVYNPIDDELQPDSTRVDINKLVFFSSPHKGLQQALGIFARLRTFLPEMTLYVSNPGYFKSTSVNLENVINLGVLPHREILQHVRESLCLFYPNYVFPETFGLVMAEANAVGTPVLTHRLGAATEVLNDTRQFVNARDNKAVIDTVAKWHEDAARDRPVVCGNAAFRLKNVVKRWGEVLHGKTFG